MINMKLNFLPGLILRFPGLFPLVLLVLLKVAGGRGCAEQDGEEGRSLHVAGGA